MSAREFLAILSRRWYVLVLAGLCTIAAVWAVRDRPIPYYGCENLEVSAPGSAWKTDPGAYGSLAAVTGMITQTAISPPTQQRNLARGVTGYTVAQTNTSGDPRNPQYTEPTLQVCATSSSPFGVLRATELVTGDLSAVLRQMQIEQHVGKDSSITIVQLTRTVPAPIVGRPKLAYLSVLFIGAVSGIALTLWADPLLARLPRKPDTGMRSTITPGHSSLGRRAGPLLSQLSRVRHTANAARRNGTSEGIKHGFR
jgi:hypothetical protein